MATGVRQRHGRECDRKVRCDCPWRAEVYSKRDGCKLRKTFPTQAAAKAWRADKLAAANKGKLRAPTSMTVRRPPRRSWPAPATVRSPRRRAPAISLRRFGATASGSTNVYCRRWVACACRMSSAATCRSFANRLTSEGLSASTVQNTLDPLRVIYRRAIRDEEVTADPTERLELRRPDGRRERIADPTEAAALIAAIAEGERALWACAFYAGLRRGELRALRWGDVDLAARVIHVSRGWDAIEREQQVKVLGQPAGADPRAARGGAGRAQAPHRRL